MKKQMEKRMEKHFVTFFTPGAIFSEETEKPVESWDVSAAVEMVDEITRYGMIPYGFQFSTRARNDDELDSKVVKTSKMYYLGGTIETLQEIEKRNDPKEEILRSNMRCNKWDKVITNNNSWKITQPFLKGDVLLPYDAKRKKLVTSNGRMIR